MKFLFQHALSRIGLTVVSAVDQISYHGLFIPGRYENGKMTQPGSISIHMPLAEKSPYAEYGEVCRVEKQQEIEDIKYDLYNAHRMPADGPPRLLK